MPRNAFDTKNMHLTAAEVEFYRVNGYVAGHRVLSAEEIDILKQRIDDIHNKKVAFPDHLLGETTKKSSAKGQLPSVKIVNLFRNDPIFSSVFNNRLISTLAHDLMEGPVRLWEDQMIYKPAFDQKTVVAWHQDYTYWNHVGPADMATCWIALDDATVANGCMHVIPGSHLWNINYPREEVDVNNPNWLLERADLPPGADLTPVACEVKAGYCHFHHCRVFHGSYGNTTDNPRRSYILHLMPGGTRRLGDSWNERHGNIEQVAIGEIVKGPSYPDLPSPL
jgi:phytanoyl-CoA hydroxylase